jgi:hypothetical protein
LFAAEGIRLSRDKANLMLRKFLQLYAIRAREFADAVARLGEYERDRRQIGQEFQRLLREIQTRQALCNASGEDLLRYVAKETRGTLLSAPGHEPAVEVDGEINEIRRETIAARERYKKADEEFCALAIQAYDVGLNHPDGLEAMRMAGNALKNINDALGQYQVAIRRLRELSRRAAN